MNPDTVAFFEALRGDPTNNTCYETGSSEPLWASVSHGIFISIEAAGTHRSLGVKTSFVLSTTLDHWNPVHLRMMELGGNKRFDDFMNSHEIPPDMPIREKYRTRAAAWYRASLRAEADGAPEPEPLTPGTGHLPMVDSERRPSRLKVDYVLSETTDSAELSPKSPSSPTSGLKASMSKWVCEQLQIVVGSPKSPGRRTELRLRAMSSGDMEGFGVDTNARLNGLEASPAILVTS